MDKRNTWFERGAKRLWILANAYSISDRLKYGSDTYICPLCLQHFTREHIEIGILTLEHVPPERLEGREVTHTCKPCNNHHGTKYDAQAVTENDLRNLFTDGRRKKVQLKVGDAVANMQMTGSGTGIILSGVPEWNPPGALDRLTETLENTQPPESSIKISHRVKLSRDYAEISWVRSAYLAAFAVFGWAYILRENLSAVVELWADPGNNLVLPIYAYDKDRKSTCRQLLLIEEPEGLRGALAITFGKHTVFLPGPNDTRTVHTLSADLNTYLAGPDGYMLTGRPFPWPTQPEHRADPASNPETA